MPQKKTPRLFIPSSKNNGSFFALHAGNSYRRLFLPCERQKETGFSVMAQGDPGRQKFSNRTTDFDKAYARPGPIIDPKAGGMTVEQEIYVDILVLLNTGINYFLLLITAVVAGRRAKPLRVLAAAFCGGMYALILLLPQCSGPVLTVTRICMAVVMTAIAFPIQSLRTFLYQCGLLYLAGFLFAGLMMAVWFLLSPSHMQYGNGIVYFHIPATALVLGILAVYSAFWIIAKFRQQIPQKEILQVRMGVGGKQVALWGMVDTGNRLMDPFTGNPVVICRYQSVKALLPEALHAYFRSPKLEQMQQAAAQGIRFIPYEAVGKTGILPVIQPDFITIEQNGKDRQVAQVTAAIADQDFFDPNYGILLHPGLQRMDRPNKKVQGEGDRYGKIHQRKIGHTVGPRSGNQGDRVLYQRTGESAAALDTGGRGEGVPAFAPGQNRQGDADRT